MRSAAMADTVEFKIEGLESLLGKLEEINTDIRRKGGRAALRKAAQLVADAAKANVQKVDDPSTAENIAKNIAVRWNGRRFKQSGDLGFRVGVLGGARNNEKYGEITTGRSGKANPGGDTWYWRFIEFGRGEVRPRKKNKKGILANKEKGEFFGSYAGPAKAQPFMRPALSENTDAATNAFVNEYEKALDRAIKRAQKKAPKGG